MHLYKNKLERSLYLLVFLIAVLSASCDNHRSQRLANTGSFQKASNKKPGSSYSDTLMIDFPATVFYSPDSLQLEQIRKVTDTAPFDGMMHEYAYLMRNARRVIKETIPGVKIIEVKNIRYLVFLNDDHTRETVDLDTKSEPFGLMLFNKKKHPQVVDMANIETALSFYFNKP